MVCPDCGAEVSAGAAFCGFCGRTVGQPIAPVAYAGFWRRVAATVIDLVVLAPYVVALCGLTMTPVTPEEAAVFQRMRSGQATQRETLAVNMRITNQLGGAMFFTFLLGWPYFALMESSRAQGTMGKIILRIKVTDLGFKRVRFRKASARYWLRPVSALPAQAGFLVAAFSKRKQALHDMLAGCLVVRE
jgi:uncharacterized RDD family membrane protein YckC